MPTRIKIADICAKIDNQIDYVDILNKTHFSFPGTAPPTTPTARSHSSNTWDSLLLQLAVRIANQLED